MIEVTVPYASQTQRDGIEENTLTLRRRQKLEKYRQLLDEFRQQPGAAAELHVIIVGSLGAIPNETMKEFTKLAPEPLAKRYAKRIVAATITGSRILYHTPRRQGTHREEAQASEDREVAPATSSDSDHDIERDGERRREELDQQGEEVPAARLARDDSSFSSGDSDSESDSIDERMRDETAESSSDDGSVVYWMSKGSAVRNAGMQ